MKLRGRQERANPALMVMALPAKLRAVRRPACSRPQGKNGQVAEDLRVARTFQPLDRRLGSRRAWRDLGHAGYHPERYPGFSRQGRGGPPRTAGRPETGRRRSFPGHWKSTLVYSAVRADGNAGAPDSLRL